MFSYLSAKNLSKFLLQVEMTVQTEKAQKGVISGCKSDNHLYIVVRAQSSVVLTGPSTSLTLVLMPKKVGSMLTPLKTQTINGQQSNLHNCNAS